MPLIKSAIKKLRKDKKRTAHNKAIKSRYKELLKKVLAEPTAESVKKAVSVIDKAAKKRMIHKNKAARLKSRVMRAKKVKAEPGGKEARKPSMKKKPRKKATTSKK